MAEGRKKGFLSRPEGKTGLLVGAGLLVGGAWLFMTILPALLVLAANVIYLGVMVGAILAVVALLMNNTFRSNISMAYKLAMRALTGLIIQIDPIGILKDKLKVMRSRLEEMTEQITDVRGESVKVQRNMENLNDEYQKYASLAVEAQKAGNQSQFTINSRKAQLREKSFKKMKGLHEKVNKMYKYLLAIYEKAKVMVEVTDDEIKVKESEYKTVTAGSSAIKAMQALMNNNQDDIYDQAEEWLEDDISMKLGEMETFMDLTHDVMEGIDLENNAFDEKALSKLDQWEKGTSLFIEEDEKAKVNKNEDLGNVGEKMRKNQGINLYN